MNSKTAILVFANSAKEEALHKPITGGHELFLELNKQTISIAQSTQLPYYVFTEENQYGTSFGERFVHAMQHVFDQGFENIITIGNDTPFLTQKHLIETAKQLENKKFVLGPSTDGGFYLMGLHRSHFEPSEFLKLPWKSKNLTEHILSLINEQGIEINTLQVLHDIDSIEDIKVVHKYRYTLSKVLLEIMEGILHNFNIKYTDYTNTYEPVLTSNFYNKGSPFSSHNNLLS